MLRLNLGIAIPISTFIKIIKKLLKIHNWLVLAHVIIFQLTPQIGGSLRFDAATPYKRI